MFALYGHPDTGTCWEKHCYAKLREAGCAPIVSWARRYRHTALRAVLSVYVDDFWLACYADDENKVWECLKGKIKLEDPAPLKQYLGCNRRLHECELAQEVRVPGGWMPVPG